MMAFNLAWSSSSRISWWHQALGCAENRVSNTHFHRHGYIRRLVQHAFYNTVRAFAEVFEQLQLFHVDGIRRTA